METPPRSVNRGGAIAHATSIRNFADGVNRPRSRRYKFTERKGLLKEKGIFMLQHLAFGKTHP